VPGLAAKPRIDVVLAVGDSADEPGYVPALEAVGYVLRIREPDWLEHRLLNRLDVAVNLHVFSSGCVEIERLLAFAIASVEMTTTERSTSGPSAISRGRRGDMCSTTRTPRRRSSRRSWSAPGAGRSTFRPLDPSESKGAP
jgi:GrpB protein